MTISRAQMGSQLMGNKMKKTKKMMRGGPAMAGRPGLGRGAFGAAGPVPAGAGGKPAPRRPQTGMIGQALAGRPKTGMIGQALAGRPKTGMIGSMMGSAPRVAGPKPKPPSSALAGLGNAVSTAPRVAGPKPAPAGMVAAQQAAQADMQRSQAGMKGPMAAGMKKGGKVRGDGCCKRGKTKGTMR